ncbi:MAG TPA: DMT family transporter, partial [Azospira sp.]|nr:DMT family transporter [Azospira sp.]
SLLGVAYVGILPSFLGYVFYNRAVAEVGANQASLFIHLMPVFGTLLSALFLGELPQPYHGAGIGLIFAGIYLTTARLPRLKER